MVRMTKSKRSSRLMAYLSPLALGVAIDPLVVGEDLDAVVKAKHSIGFAWPHGAPPSRIAFALHSGWTR